MRVRRRSPERTVFPCQFDGLPTNGDCEAMGAISIDSGHYSGVVLGGVAIAVVFQWPGPIHEGKGKCQPIVDERASPAQREAVLKIMTGQDTDPFATMFSVFASTLDCRVVAPGARGKNPARRRTYRSRAGCRTDRLGWCDVDRVSGAVGWSR